MILDPDPGAKNEVKTIVLLVHFFQFYYKKVFCGSGSALVQELMTLNPDKDKMLDPDPKP
jgi:hypothetical protein